jgi:hypothetical protein
VGRIAQGTKVLAEGGHDRIFRQAFSAPPDEQLRKSYACYLSTAAGPVMGVLYLSTARVAFCSDSPLSYEASGGDRTEWTHYKVSENHSQHITAPTHARSRVLQSRADDAAGGDSSPTAAGGEPVGQQDEARGEVHPAGVGGQPRVLVHGLRQLRRRGGAPAGSAERVPQPAGVTSWTSMQWTVLSCTCSPELINRTERLCSRSLRVLPC